MVEEVGFAEHPGSFIRSWIIPAGMSVTEAAERLGVGRPALSNLLNGNAALSPEMAMRLEKVFGANRDELLRHQTEYDRRNELRGDGEMLVRPYVPPFLQITSRQIDEWADRIDTRHLLPVLLRLLIVSTHDGLSRVTFPGHDDAERHGWDGLLEADSATPWIPTGSSCWEFGTSRRPSEKADRDYRDKLRPAVPFADRTESTFVFVTPRRWPGATDWAAAKQREGHWQAVKALDASDLEAWLTQSIPAQIWLAEQLQIDTDGVETLDRFWDRWSAASNPKLAPEVFGPSLEAYREKVTDWLSGKPERPFVISADSTGEAIAFLACLFRGLQAGSPDDPNTTRPSDLAAVFDSPSTLRRLAASRTPFLPVVRSEECERELAPVHGRLHCVTVRPRNATQSDPDIALDLLDHEAFTKALESMDIDRDGARRLERESGRSPTILRRRLSKIESIRTPEWAEETTRARALIPLTLAGVWNCGSPADQEVVARLADRSYDAVDKDLAAMLLLNDSPVWAAGQHRGVVSKIDALFAIRAHITRADLSAFFTVARDVLAESDPALDLPQNRRWAAALYEKVRHHSAALRRSICETLVIFSVHGNHLFRDWPGVDVEVRVSSLIRELLTPLTLEKLLSHDRDLPGYAEAAPTDFLHLIEDDLQHASPVVMGLLEPADSGIFGGCPRTGLLWALESLAWRHVSRVSMILAHLARVPIDDNWANKPINSLKAIYRSWLPQTAASLEDRKKALKALADRFPDVAWQLCMDELSGGRPRIGHFSHRPRWRSDATGAGRGVAARERSEFVRFAVDIVHDWPSVDQHQWQDLIRHAPSMSEDDQAQVWDRVIDWGRTQGDDHSKAALREEIRLWYLTRRGTLRNLDPATITGARRTYRSLEPTKLVMRHKWLFAKQSVEPSTEDVGDPNASYVVRQEVIWKQRDTAITEIWEALGKKGVISFLAEGAIGDIVGISLARVVPPGARADFLERCLSSSGQLSDGVDACIQGLLGALADEERAFLVEGILANNDPHASVRVLLAAPFREHTWRLVEGAGQAVEDAYWQNVTPQWAPHSESELTELVARLAQAERPRSALWLARRDWSLVETSRLRQLLFDRSDKER